MAWYNPVDWVKNTVSNPGGTALNLATGGMLGTNPITGTSGLGLARDVVNQGFGELGDSLGLGGATGVDTSAQQGRANASADQAYNDGRNILGQQQQQAAGLFSQAQGSPYSAQTTAGAAPSVAGMGAPQQPQRAPMSAVQQRAQGMAAGLPIAGGLGGTGNTRLPGGAPGTTQSVQSPATAGGAPMGGIAPTVQGYDLPGNVAQAGPLGQVAQAGPAMQTYGQLGAAPQAGGAMQIAGQLGGIAQAGPAMQIAGQLGGAPGNIYGQAGNMGQSSAQQQQMLGRLNQFLDAGDGPSVAEAQLQQAQADNAANLIGAARSGRGGAGASAAALRGAVSEGSAIASDTAGQMATLRAQEEDFRRGRQLQGIGLGGQMASDIRSGDLSYRGQDIQQLMADQSTQLGARGQNLNALLGDQSAATQTNLANLAASLQGRGQDVQALLGDQSASTNLALGNLQAATTARGQDAGLLSNDQRAATDVALANLGASMQGRGQDLDLGLGNLQAGVSQRGQTLDALQGQMNAGVTQRGQTIGAQTADADRLAGLMTADANRQLTADELNLRRQLGFTDAGLAANQQGLNYALGQEGNALGWDANANNWTRTGMGLTPEQQQQQATMGAIYSSLPALLGLL